jgi:hypothetical protein
VWATRRVKLGAGAVSGVLILSIGASVVLASGGGGSDRSDPAAAAVENKLVRDQPERTTPTSTTTSTAPTTTEAPVAPPTTAARVSDLDEGDDDTPAPPPRAAAPLSTPAPPAPMPSSPPWVDTRPEAIDYSASCRTTGPTTVVGTARIVWSDGFVDEFSATFTSPGYNQSAGGGQRGWWVIVSVIAPPAGAIGDYTCSNASTGGPLRWNG